MANGVVPNETAHHGRLIWFKTIWKRILYRIRKTRLFVVVPADKASNNIVFVCKTHYINCLMEELGMSTMTGNPTYNLTAMSK